jgi:hypothetical protein
MGVILLLGRSVSAVWGAALGRVVLSDRLKVRARTRSAANLGMAFGGGGGAVAIAIGSHTALVLLVVIDAVSFLACAALARTLGHDRQPRTGSRYSLTSLTDGRYVLACVVNTFACLHNSLMWSAFGSSDS